MKVFNPITDLKNLDVLTTRAEDTSLIMEQVAQNIHPIGALIPWPQQKPGSEDLPSGYIYLDGTQRYIRDLPILARIYGPLYGLDLTNGLFTLPLLNTYEIIYYVLVSGVQTTASASYVNITGQTQNLVIKPGDKIEASSEIKYSIDNVGTRGLHRTVISAPFLTIGQEANLTTNATGVGNGGASHFSVTNVLSSPNVAGTVTVAGQWHRNVGSDVVYSLSGTLSIRHYVSIPYITRAG